MEQPWFVLVPYEPGEAAALTKMWRDSKEHAQGFSEAFSLVSQQRFLEEHLATECELIIAKDRATEALVGLLATKPGFVEQLYVHVDFQGRGLGSHLLQLAKDQAASTLRLYTLEPNTQAHGFYERHGFRLEARGFADQEQVPDRLYVWERGVESHD